MKQHLNDWTSVADPANSSASSSLLVSILHPCCLVFSQNFLTQLTLRIHLLINLVSTDAFTTKK